MSLQIFVSYARQDIALVDSLLRAIQECFAERITFFRDRPLPGVVDSSIPPGKWLPEIETQLRTADYVLVVCTPAFLCHNWFFAEAAGALLFGKRLIPVCIPPICKQHLPLPVSAALAYDATADDLGAFLRTIGGCKCPINLDFMTDITPDHSLSSRSKPQAADFDSLTDRVDGPVEFRRLRDFREIVGGALRDLAAKQRGSLALESHVTIDRYGNGTIRRQETYTPTTGLSHTYYHLYSDAPGRKQIVSASLCSDSRASLPVAVHLDTGSQLSCSIYFDRIYLPGETVCIQIDAYCENLLSNIVEHRRAQQDFKDIGKNWRISSHTQTWEFPIDAFSDLKAHLVLPVDKIVESVPTRDGKALRFSFDVTPPNETGGIIIDFWR